MNPNKIKILNKIIEAIKIKFSSLKYLLLITGIIFTCFSVSFAQQQPNQEQKSTSEKPTNEKPATEKPDDKLSKPIELPTIVIDGIEQLNVRSGIKQFPKNSRPFSKDELDSLNSLDKLQPFLLPAEQLPEKNTLRQFYKGFVKGEFGRYTSPLFEGGYDFYTPKYKWFVNAGAESSDGNVENSEYSKEFARITNEYISPDSFWIFGNSFSKFNLDLSNNNYRLYGSASAPSRSVFNLNLGTNTEGDYEDYRFFTGANLLTYQMSTSGRTTPDYGLNAYLKTYNKANEYQIGVAGIADIHSFNSHGTHFLEANTFGNVNFQNVQFNLKAGLQTAGTDFGIERAGFLAEISSDYHVNREFSINGRIYTGLENNSFQQLLFNPYISDSAKLDYAYNKFAFELSCFYHPNQYVGITTGARIRSVDRFPYYVSMDSAFYDVKYGTSSLGEIFTEGFFDINTKSSIIYSANIRFSTLQNGNDVPYIAPVDLSIDYKQEWFENFGTLIGLSYIGERNVSDTLSRTLSGFANVHLNADYIYNKRFKFYLNLNNLTNSSIYYWNYYKERDIFFALGVIWQF